MILKYFNVKQILKQNNYSLKIKLIENVYILIKIFKMKILKELNYQILEYNNIFKLFFLINILIKKLLIELNKKFNQINHSILISTISFLFISFSFFYYASIKLLISSEFSSVFENISFQKL